MKIWYQSSGSIGSDPKWLPYEGMLRRHVDALAKKDTEWIFKGIEVPRKDIGKQEDIASVRHKQFVENAFVAEEMGFSVFAIGCWQDHGHKVIKEQTDLIVSSVAEAAIHAALILGQRAGLIVPSRNDEDIIRSNLSYYGIDSSKLIFQECPFEIEALLRSFEKVSIFMDRITSVVQHVIENGADVLLLGCGIFNEIAYKHEIREIGKIPVIDCVGALIETTERQL